MGRNAGIDHFGLDDMVAIVTGGASGLGRAISLGFAAAGAAVAVADIDEAQASSVASQVEMAGGEAMAVGVDVASLQDVRTMVDCVTAWRGRVDALVNCAGIGGSSMQDPPEDIWERVIRVNLTGTYLCCQEVGRHMVERGRGRIVNIASISGSIVNRVPPNDGPGAFRSALALSAYCASKAGVRHLTKSLAVAWARCGVRVNSISPGYMDTPMNAARLRDETSRRNMIDTTPMGRIAAPDEIVGGAIYLISDASSFVTGHDLVVDGGHTCW